jgi:hypothetical protein
MKENENPENSNPYKSRVTESSNSDKNKLLCDNECLNDYMEIDVQDDAWLEVLNGRLTIEKIINYDGIHRYMTERNREYCEQNGLCEECRSELVEVYEPYNEHFGRPVGEKMSICPKCG